MHICFIADANSIHTQRWIMPLQELGYQTTLISYKSIEEDIDWIRTYDLTTINNTSVVRFIIWSRHIKRLLNEVKPDILHSLQITGAGWLGYLAGFHPFVASAWGSDILLAQERSIAHRTITGKVISHSDILTVPSKLMFEKAVELGVSEDRLKLIPWGVETSTFQSEHFNPIETRKRFGINPDHKVLLCPRGINRIYNIDVAIRAFRSAMEIEPSSRLAIVLKSVEDDYYRELQELVSELGLEEFIHWLPKQKNLAEMARLYHMSDILISIPSSEGYGFTVFEAMASGCPTLISDLPVFEGVLINEVNTLKVPVHSIDKTSQALVRLLGNHDLWSKIRLGGLEFSLNETVEKRVRQAEGIYSNLAESLKS